MNWSQSVDSLLDKIRLNAVYLTNRHINNHLYYKNCSKYFEIPTIVLSVFSGSFSVGSDGFLNQELISIELFYFYVDYHINFNQTLHEDSRKFYARARTCRIF